MSRQQESNVNSDGWKSTFLVQEIANLMKAVNSGLVTSNNFITE